MNNEVEHAVTMSFLSTEHDDKCVELAVDFLVDRWPDLQLTRGAPQVDRRGPFVQVTVYFHSDIDWRPSND